MRDAASDAERLVGIGATHVVFTLADARDRILSVANPEQKTAAVASALPASGGGGVAAEP